MQTAANGMRLYEALELRAEYNARMTTIKNCIGGSGGGKRQIAIWHDDKSRGRPSPEFDVSREREMLRGLEYKQRKLNSAIQKANYETQIEFDGQAINLMEALEIRKGLSAQIEEINSQLVDSAYEKVIYKEGRDIIEANPVPYTELNRQLAKARIVFRVLNRKLRLATFETVVAYEDEC